jgi:anti-sigma factor RsiW
MPVSETDLELLETYLDEALPPSQVEAVRRRLVGEPELSSALTELNSPRSLRAALWATLEPTDVATQQMNWRIRGALADRSSGGVTRFSSWVTARVGSVAAACIMVGFFAGRMGHAPVAPPTQNTSPAVAVNQPAAAPTATPTPMASLYVPVTNEYGQVVAWQPFQNADQAKSFVESLHGNAVVAPTDDKVKLVSQENY